MPFVSVEKHGRVAIARFDKGDGRNTLSLAAMRELTATARSLADDADLSAVVLTGTSKVFSYGFDLKDAEYQEVLRGGIGMRRRAAGVGPAMCKAWEEIPAYTILALEGHCIGGGAALAVAFDFIVAGEGASLAVPEIDRGMNLSWGAVPRLINLIGPARAKQFAIGGKPVDALTAAQWGLVQEVVASGEAVARAMAIASDIAAKPPIAVQMIKRLANAYAGALVPSVSALDGDQFTLAGLTDDFKEGIASFIEKRPPHFKGR